MIFRSRWILVLLTVFISFKSLLGQTPTPEIQVLGNYEIVLLGEQSHGDGAVFEKKLEIVKELHEKQGFNLLLFECGLYDNFKANQLYDSQKENKNIFKKSISYLYSSTQVFDKLLEYVKDNPNLKILGFDSQESYLFEEYFLEDLQKLCSKNNMAISGEDIQELEKVLVVRDLEGFVDNDRDSVNLYNKMNCLLERLDNLPKNDLETQVLVQTFKSSFADMDFTLKSLQKEKIHVQNPRDAQMAENLIFIKEVYPTEKIMGWGASYHFANRIDEFEYTDLTEAYIGKQFAILDSVKGHKHTELNDEIAQIKDLKNAMPMGRILKEKYGDKLFSLAFTAFQGTYLDVFEDKLLSILEPPSNSLETNIKNQKIVSKLELLKDSKLKSYSSVLGYIPLFANWSNIFDGVYYIENMFPPVYQDYVSQENFKENSGKNTFVEGNVLDAENGEEIAFVDIYYSDNNKSTVTDNQGRFQIANELKTDNFLIISAMGYESDTLRLQHIKKTNEVYLARSEERITSLDEVVVTAKHKPLSPQEVLKRARKNITNNYIQTPFNQEFHFKITENQLKDSSSYGEEAIIKTYCSKGINGSSRPEIIFFGEIKHLRNNTNRYEKGRFNNGVASLWVILNRDIILSKSNVLYRTSSYDLTYEGMVDYEGRKVYKISFVNNSPGSYSTGYGYPAPKASNGIIFINRDNYAILKYEHVVERSSYVDKKTKNTINTTNTIVQTYKQVNGKYFFNLLKVVNTTDVYSPENQFQNTYVKEEKLTSENIETQNVRMFDRPIVDLKKGFKKKENDPFWLEKKMDFTTTFLN